jgi:NTP pyrophosphatase (non-canonical NTP hydrolase)
VERPAFQETVAGFLVEHNLQTPVVHRLLDVASELGELAKEAVEATGYGREEFEPSEHWKEELGDLFFSLICLANESDVNLEEALEKALEKYRERIAASGSPTSGS